MLVKGRHKSRSAQAPVQQCVLLRIQLVLGIHPSKFDVGYTHTFCKATIESSAGHPSMAGEDITVLHMVENLVVPYPKITGLTVANSACDDSSAVRTCQILV